MSTPTGLVSSPITQGTVSRERRAPGVTLTETVHARELELPVHCHREAALTVVLDGEFEERFGGTRFDLGRLRGLYKPPGFAHSNRYGPRGARSLLIALEPEAYERLMSLAREPAVEPFPLSPCLAARVLALYSTDSAFEETALGWEELFAHLLERRHDHHGRESGRPTWLARVEESLRERFAEPLRLGVLAEEVEVHPVHLARVYRRFHGRSIGDAIRRRRVEHAVERLLAGAAEPERPEGRPDLACIALECGFADQSHLTRAFRRETGLSPARFRRRALRILHRSEPSTGEGS